MTSTVPYAAEMQCRYPQVLGCCLFICPTVALGFSGTEDIDPSKIQIFSSVFSNAAPVHARVMSSVFSRMFDFLICLFCHTVQIGPLEQQGQRGALWSCPLSTCRSLFCQGSLPVLLVVHAHVKKYSLILFRHNKVLSCS